MSTDKRASNFIIPYPVQENPDGSIVFTTDAGITYQVGFVDACPTLLAPIYKSVRAGCRVRPW